MAGHKRAGGDELLCESNSNAKKAKRQTTKATFEIKSSKWSTRCYRGCDVTLMPKEPTWSLYCAICRKYEANIRPLKNFRRDWIVGPTNQRTSNLIDHATSDVHKAVMAKLKVERSRARGESTVASYPGRVGGERRPGTDCLRMRDHPQKNLGTHLRLEIAGKITMYMSDIFPYHRKIQPFASRITFNSMNVEDNRCVV